MATSEGRAALFALILFGSWNLILGVSEQDNSTSSGPAVRPPLVFLTVSSLASRADIVEDRILELNWAFIPDTEREDASIQLYDADPENGGQPLLSVTPSDDTGYHRTNIRFHKVVFGEQNLTDNCLGYYVAYVVGRDILASDCLRARPHWMQQLRPTLGNLSLADIMIPGTHNAGSYAPFDWQEDNMLNRYLLTQEEDVWTQLVYGIRYLDLRVAYHRTDNSEEKFWITHSSFRTDLPVREVLRQVRRFLNATSEIVIVDFHRFVEGFGRKEAAGRHRELKAMIEEELGDLVIPTRLTPWSTLDALWDAGKRAYVGYADSTARWQSRYLFPPIRHQWANVDKIRQLKEYFDRTECGSGPQRRLTSAMAQLTPSTMGAIFNFYGGLRNMADTVNREVTRWFRDKFAGCANIVATDYFLGNNIISVAIETNKERKPVTSSGFS